jgi:hypothetical protein
MRLKFCAACGSAGDLQYHHLVAGQGEAQKCANGVSIVTRQGAQIWT